MSILTEDQFKLVLPDKMKKHVNQSLIDQINQTLSSPEEMELYKENLISYTHVLQEGKFQIPQYLDAVRYVGFKVMGHSDKDAYIKTFPDKYQKFVADGVAAKDIASYITAYNKGKLVNLILAQTLVPTHVLNAAMWQEALNEQFILGKTAKSEMVRATALNSVLTQLKPPESKKMELQVNMPEDSSLNVLRQAMIDLAKQQQGQIQAGLVDAQSVAHQRLVLDQDMKDVTP
jgi:hypothetical protein